MKFNHMGKLIIKLRMEKDISQEAFKNLFDSSKKAQYISNMERGISSLPIKYHLKVAIGINVSVELFKEAYMKDADENYDRRVK